MSELTVESSRNRTKGELVCSKLTPDETPEHGSSALVIAFVRGLTWLSAIRSPGGKGDIPIDPGVLSDMRDLKLLFIEQATKESHNKGSVTFVGLGDVR
jgi:hypothetical protein